MEIRDLLIECAHEVGYIECQGTIMPPEHYSRGTRAKTIVFIKNDGRFTDVTLRIFTVIENGMKYIGTGNKVTEMDIRDPKSLEQFKKILEYGNDRISKT